MRNLYSRAAQRARLLADGHKALALLNAGRSISDCMLVIDGSRARLYRAMMAAASDGQYAGNAPATRACDPLLL